MRSSLSQRVGDGKTQSDGAQDVVGGELCERARPAR